jgi:DNA-binding Lrp family transcriptional regulator
MTDFIANSTNQLYDSYKNFSHNDDKNMQYDDLDQKLIRLLTENARIPISDVARILGIARMTAQARLDRLISHGAIAGFTIRAGQKLRPPLRATALLTIEPRSGAAVLQRLKSLDTVERVSTTSGRFDMLIDIYAHDTEELDQTLDKIGEIKGVKGSESLIHLSQKIDRT